MDAAIAAECLAMVGIASRQPQPDPEVKYGDAVRMPDGRIAYVGVSYGDGLVGVCYSPSGFFFGPSVGPPDPEHPELDHASLSGGPWPDVAVSDLIATGETVTARCWHWGAYRGAGMGVNYDRQVPLWRMKETLAQAADRPAAENAPQGVAPDA